MSIAVFVEADGVEACRVSMNRLLADADAVVVRISVSLYNILLDRAVMILNLCICCDLSSISSSLQIRKLRDYDRPALS